MISPRMGAGIKQGHDLTTVWVDAGEVLVPCPVTEDANRPHLEVQPCRSSEPLPIIGVPALLKLADWSRLRLEQAQHGGSPCDTPRPGQSPPRTLKPSQRIPLTHLWEALPQSDRDRTLLTLSRVVAQQLPKTSRRQGGRS